MADCKVNEGDCVFDYIYRDGGNFKTHGQLLLTGYRPEAEQMIRGCLEWDGQFVAEQVRVPSLCREHWEAVDDGPSDLDHAFHEFVSLRLADEGDAGLKAWGPLDSFLEQMRAAKGKWDVTLSPNCDL